MVETFESRTLLASYSLAIYESQVNNGALAGGSLSPDFHGEASWREYEARFSYYLHNPDGTRFFRGDKVVDAGTDTFPNGETYEAQEGSQLIGTEITTIGDFNGNGQIDPSETLVTETYRSRSYGFQIVATEFTDRIVMSSEGSVPSIPLRPDDPDPEPNTTGNVTVRLTTYKARSVAGVVFDDKDRNGVQTVDESSLAGRRVRLLSGDQVLSDRLTDDTGTYNLYLGQRGLSLPSAIPLPLFTGPDPSAQLRVELVDANATQTSASAEFPISTTPPLHIVGAFQHTTVSGIVYTDQNGNGTIDLTEPRKDGFMVYVDRNNDGRFTDADRPVVGENPVFTNVSGQYTIKYDGIGVVRGDTRVTPASLFSFSQGNNPGYQTLGGMPLVGGNFGVFQNAVVGGHVYLDVNGNGRRDLPGDVAASGLIVELDHGNDGVVDHTTTVNSEGNYSFLGVPRGPFRISLAPASGVKQTAPSSVRAHVGTVTTFAQGIGPLDFGVQRGKDVSVSDATFDGKTIKFKYGTTQITSPFNVGFFQSSDAVWDSADKKLELFIQIDPQTAGEQGSGEYTLREPYKHDPTKPYILVVADPGKLITETSETNNVLKATRTIDIGPLKAVGNFQYDPTTDRFKANGAVTIGYKPETAEPFFPLVTVNGEVSYDSKIIYSSGLVTATVGAFSAPLFNGKWDLRIADQISTALKPTAFNLTVAGIGFKFHSLKFANPVGGLTLDSYIELTGKVAIPFTASEQTQFKPVEIEFTAENPLKLKSDGPSLAGRINLPPFKFELFGMEIETESVTLEYFHPRRAFRLQGKVTLNKLLPGLLGDRVEKVVADFADTNYLEVNHLGFAAVGSISVDKVVLVPNQYELRNLKFSFNTLNSEWRGEGELKFPLLPGNTTLLAGLGFRNSELNFISLGADHLNIPLPLAAPTGRFVVLQKVQLALDNLVDVDPHAVEFAATVGIADSFELLAPPIQSDGLLDLVTGPFLRADFTGKISGNHLVGGIDVTVMHKDFVNITGQGELDWKELHNPGSVFHTAWERLSVKAKGTLKALKGAVEGKFDMTYAADLSTPASTRSLTGTGEVTFKFTDSQKEALKAKLPEWVAKRLVDRSVVGKGSLNLVDDGNASNDYLVVYGDVELPVIGRKTFGFRASLDGEFQWLSNLVEVAAASTAPPAAAAESSGGASSFAGLALSETSASTASANEFTIGAGQQNLLLAASWQNDVGDVPLEVVTPSGSVIPEADFESAGIAVLTDFSTRTSKAIGLSAPAAGTWIVRVANSEGLGDVVYEGAHESDLPTVAITSVTREDSIVTIDYTAADPDSDAIVRFFYDTDGEGFDGVQFGSDVTETDSTSSTTWDVSNLPAGTYHIYAMIDDGNNAPVFAYAETPVVIAGLPTSISGIVFEDSDASGIRDDGELPLANWTVFLDANNNGVLDNPVSGNNVADAHATEVWTQSNANGEYAFANVTLGAHTLAVVNQTGFTPTFTLDGEPLLVVVSEDNPQLEIDLGHDRVPPVITSLSQTAVLAGSVTGANFLTLTIRGTNFVAGSPNPVQVVEINTPVDPSEFVARTTIVDSPTQMRVLIPADQLATARTARLRINHTDVGLSNVFDLLVSSNVVSISPANASKLEGNTETTPFTFTVTRTGNTTESATLDYVVSGSGVNAANTDDFNGLFPIGTITFAPGQTSQVITIDVSGDTDVELTETFDVRLTNAVGTAIANSNATGTITNDDTSFTIATTNASKLEGNTGSTPLTFTITRNGLTTGIGSVKFTVTGNGANPADKTDFGSAFPTGTVNFAANEISKPVTVSVKGETLFELDETFAVTLNTPTGGVLAATASATGTILNDDTAITISANDAIKAEGTGNTPTPFTFTVTRLGNLNLVSSVKFTAAANGSGATAAAASDFVGGKFLTGIVNFAIGEATKVITFPVIADTTLEGNESFKVTLSSPTGASLHSTAVATTTIRNDDTSLAIAATAATKSEGQTGSTPFTFTVTRTGDTSGISTATYTVTGVATNGANATDFGGSFPTGTVEFAATQTTKLITINVTGDNLAEGNEGFVVTLSSPTNAIFGTASANGTINNDDTSYSIAVQSATSANKNEGNVSNTTFTFVVTRIGVAIAGSVQFAVLGSGDHPADATDFTTGVPPTGTLNFTAGQTSQTVTINIKADKTIETNETFTIRLLNPSLGISIITADATGTIINDD